MDEQAKADELAERKKQKESGAIATDDGMPVGPENRRGEVETIRYSAPNKWVRSTRKWPGVPGAAIESVRSSSPRRKADLS
ncbi:MULTISPECIES: hypothetical protein [Paraburkholderia]|uniref:hypothetical protein n=1 Tax=Paraburkholderia TaxID=1822464 RepID=UPI00224CCFD4|nr:MULTISPECIES: hypothetical protein [Paraburkholderia]MCX4161889.1 hypothetical protein [Paraburkholderia megapolitana]MDN7157386.1 hypothetical protein [Paraburkholderia sp. CHISQ3]MDQ6494431.1 hypothetical protein [Paraburkholderia megapolitana]